MVIGMDVWVAKRTRRRQSFAGALVDLRKERGVKPIDRVAQADRKTDLDDLFLGEVRS